VLPRAQAASDARAVAAYETLVALHEINTQELAFLEGQSKVLDSVRTAVIPASGRA
jgi:hypothetical protein